MDMEVPMVARVRQTFQEINSRLSDLDLSRDILLDIVRAAVAAHAGCTDNDPPGARGYESWRAGVRRSREVLLPLGWTRDNSGGYCTCVNHEKMIRLAILNSDDGAGTEDRVPQNRSKKGPNSDRAAAANRTFFQPGLFGDDEWPVQDHDAEPVDLSDFATWHLCIHIDNDNVQADLCMLENFEGGFASGFLEKIILVAPGEWNQLPNTDKDDDDDQDFTIDVQRK